MLFLRPVCLHTVQRSSTLGSPWLCASFGWCFHTWRFEIFRLGAARLAELALSPLNVVVYVPTVRLEHVSLQV